MKDKEILNDLKEFIKSEKNLADICTKYELSELQVLGIISKLKETGLNIIDAKKDDGIHILNLGQKENLSTNNREFYTDENNEIEFLIISDTRFGSIYAQKSILNEIYLRAYNKGIKNVLHCGNISEGLYKINSKYFETLICNDTLSQADYIIDNYPSIEGMSTYFITGPKDDTHLNTKQLINIGKQISKHRSDLIYLGNGRCNILVDKVKLLMINLKLCKTYTQSYRPQQFIDAIRSENKPGFLLYGGLLQREEFKHRNIVELSIPSVTATTEEMSDKRYANMVGAIHLKIKTDEKGNLESYKTLVDPYYVTYENDYEKAKTLTIRRDK